MTRAAPFTAFVLLLLIPGFCLVPVAHSDIHARLRIIEASNVGATIDPSLTDVHDQLGSLFSFTSYRLLRDVNVSLSGNRPVEIPVHRGRSIEITLVEEYRNTVELKIRIIREGATILNTRVRLSSGRTVLIGGPRHGEGTAILALSARF